ncbi:response regulator [Halovulum sp. GXIMD14794]
MTGTCHILIVDDELEIQRLTKRFLGQYDLRVSVAGSGDEALRALQEWNIDLVVLDIMLPGMDGFETCRMIRRTSRVPIIMVTAVRDDADRIMGLELGADDYMTKPFNPRELVARIRAVLRRAADRAQGGEVSGTRVGFDGWALDLERRELRAPDGSLVTLSSGEFSMLQAFIRNPMTPLRREQLCDMVQGREPGAFDRSVDVQVSRLRRKVEADPNHPALIKTIRNVGYQFCAEVQPIAESGTR